MYVLNFRFFKLLPINMNLFTLFYNKMVMIQKLITIIYYNIYYYDNYNVLGKNQSTKCCLM
jgi:hypothetical protein